VNAAPGRLRGLLPLLPVLLCGCATPLAIVPGATEPEIRARFGAPTAVYDLDGGAARERLEYATGPYAQKTYMVDLDADGRALRAWQALTETRFAGIRIGEDTQQSIRREFGTPHMLRRYALSGLTAWEYPYKEASVWNSVMSVYFDAAGIVRRTESGPDPRFDLREGHGHGHR